MIIFETSPSVIFSPRQANMCFSSSKPMDSCLPSPKKQLKMRWHSSMEYSILSSQRFKNSMNSSCSSSPPPSASISFIRSSASSSLISIWQALNIFIIQFLETLPELSASNSMKIRRYSSLVLRLPLKLPSPLIWKLIYMFDCKGYPIIGGLSSFVGVDALGGSGLGGIAELQARSCGFDAFSFVRVELVRGWDIVGLQVGLVILRGRKCIVGVGVNIGSVRVDHIDVIVVVGGHVVIPHLVIFSPISPHSADRPLQALQPLLDPSPKHKSERDAQQQQQEHHISYY